MLDITKLQKKIRQDEYIGTRITEELKAALDRFCKDKKLKTSVILTALVEQLLRDNDYIK